MTTKRSWCCNTAIDGPHKEGCLHAPNPDNGPNYAPASFVRWDESDLDRCEHGRHSVDPCADCGGQSTGNLFLFVDRSSCLHFGREGQEEVGVRIGTAYNGQPIIVQPVRHPFAPVLPKPPSSRGWVPALEADPPKGWVLRFKPKYGQYAGQIITRTFVVDELDLAIGVMRGSYGEKSMLLSWKALGEDYDG